MPRAKSAAPHAVYRGQDVKLFAQDLSNYAQLRRGLSTAMRAQTLTKTELKNVSPDVAIRYINALNEWRQSPQREKIVRGQSSDITRLEGIFEKARQSNFFGPNDRAKLAAANLTIKTMNQEQARWEIREALNAVDRVHGSAWYTPADYWANDFYMSHGEWDPSRASDSMLRVAIQYDLLADYPEYDEATKEEYRQRLDGDLGAAIIASE